MPIVSVKGVKVNYEVVGQGNAILFLHGMSGSAKDWANQMKVLSPGYKVITIDERGHGKSESPKKEEEYSIPVIANDILAVLNQEGIKRCCLGGHSVGGTIILNFTLAHPGMVAGLVLVDYTSSEFSNMAQVMVAMRTKLGEIARAQGLAAAFEYDAANNQQRIDLFKRHPEQKEKSRQKVLSMTVDSYIFCWQALRKSEMLTPRLSEIKVPALIFLGDEDVNLAGAAQTLKNGIAGSELVTIKGAGHNPHEDNPTDFNNALLKFINKVRW